MNDQYHFPWHDDETSSVMGDLIESVLELHCLFLIYALDTIQWVSNRHREKWKILNLVSIVAAQVPERSKILAWFHELQFHKNIRSILALSLGNEEIQALDPQHDGPLSPGESGKGSRALRKRVDNSFFKG